MKKYLFILLLLIAGRSFGQTDSVINRMIGQKLDSFKHTLDSVQVISRTVTGNGVFNVDTLTVPTRTMGVFTIMYMLDDAASTRQYVGIGQKVVYITNWNGSYNVMAILDIIPYLTVGGLPQGPLNVKLINGLPIMTIGNPSVVTIKWRFFIEEKLNPL